MYFLCCRLLFNLFFFFFRYARAALQNVTIDDTNNGGQITYKPDGYWNGPGCSSCDAHPDPSQAFEGTWSDTTCVWFLEIQAFTDFLDSQLSVVSTMDFFC